MRIENEILLDFKDVLIRPKRSTLTSRQEVSLVRSYKFKHSGLLFDGIPIIAANMDGVGTFSMTKALDKHNMTVALRKAYSLEEWREFYAGDKNPAPWFTIGTSEDDLAKFAKMSERFAVTKVCLDVANGYTEKFVETVKYLRSNYPHTTIMAGNVVTGDMVEALILAGADVVKVGIGPGSVCTTRKMTGVGYPQLSAIIECADAAHGLGGLICADGGCQVPGDIAKAFGGGADFVMLGGMLAGHMEGEYDWEYKDAETGGETREGRPVRGYAKFYGMSSDTAQIKHTGEKKSYRASEGKTVTIELKGPVENTLIEILGGLRSACTYVGAKELKELSKRTTFVRVSQQLNPLFGS